MMTRRGFLKAMALASSGLVLPDWLIKAENHIDIEGAPLLESPGRREKTIYAMDWGGDEFQLSLGNPYADPGPLTWREYLPYCGCNGLDEYFESSNPADWAFAGVDEPVSAHLADEYWVRNGSPEALAYDYLDGLNLGPVLRGQDTDGEIHFHDGVAPGNNSKIVAVPDKLSLSLLQKHLNELDGTVEIAMAHSDLKSQVQRVEEDDISLEIAGLRAIVGLQWQASYDLKLAYRGSGSSYRLED